ncbi:hypothetical protein V6N12_050715 [Hibiscus sabdariffa]|uniref:Uncharacterized protein n=1 Tax=Hibiscus sabdariffa TaxID=183260 RepID=A0ABR2GD75_9ROSI
MALVGRFFLLKCLAICILLLLCLVALALRRHLSSLALHPPLGLALLFQSLFSILLVAKNGLPRMIGACSSVSQYRIRKSARNINFSTCTSMSSIFPSGCTYEQSACCSITVVGLASPMPSFWKTDLGIRLMFAPRSHKAVVE